MSSAVFFTRDDVTGIGGLYTPRTGLRTALRPMDAAPAVGARQAVKKRGGISDFERIVSDSPLQSSDNQFKPRDEWRAGLSSEKPVEELDRVVSPRGHVETPKY